MRWRLAMVLAISCALAWLAAAGRPAAAEPGTSDDGAAPELELGATLALYDRYVWRGLTLVDRPVLQPDLHVAAPIAGVLVTLGTWANVELGCQRGDDGLSVGGGTRSLDLSELDPYAELELSVGRLGARLGAIAYLYPNRAGYTHEDQSAEAYLELELDAPLAPSLAIHWDFVQIRGAYLELGVAHALSLTPRTSLELSLSAGLSAGQAIREHADGSEIEAGNFAQDGLTHVEVGVAVPLALAGITVTPSAHAAWAHDDFTRYTDADHQRAFKAWVGLELAAARPVRLATRRPALAASPAARP
jgi:hypothetical protein